MFMTDSDHFDIKKMCESMVLEFIPDEWKPKRCIKKLLMFVFLCYNLSLIAIRPKRWVKKL